MMNGAQSPLPSPHAGRVSSPAPLISAAAPGNATFIFTSGEEIFHTKEKKAEKITQLKINILCFYILQVCMVQ